MTGAVLPDQVEIMTSTDRAMTWSARAVGSTGELHPRGVTLTWADSRLTRLEDLPLPRILAGTTRNPSSRT